MPGTNRRPLGAAQVCHGLRVCEEGRVLGCLVEKELTTPQQYPLTENALIAALIWWALNGQRLSRDSRGL
jgi:uncharacterized protein YceH (UPF0502 family)